MEEWGDQLIQDPQADSCQLQLLSQPELESLSCGLNPRASKSRTVKPWLGVDVHLRPDTPPSPLKHTFAVHDACSHPMAWRLESLPAAPYNQADCRRDKRRGGRCVLQGPDSKIGTEPGYWGTYWGTYAPSKNTVRQPLTKENDAQILTNQRRWARSPWTLVWGVNPF